MHISCDWISCWLKLVCVCTKAGVFKRSPFVINPVRVYWIAGSVSNDVCVYQSGACMYQGCAVLNGVSVLTRIMIPTHTTVYVHARIMTYTHTFHLHTPLQYTHAEELWLAHTTFIYTHHFNTHTHTNYDSHTPLFIYTPHFNTHTHTNYDSHNHFSFTRTTLIHTRRGLQMARSIDNFC